VLRDLDNKDTTILKGLAICAIVFHNFFHVLGRVRENEFTFDSSRFPIFLHAVIHPSTSIQAFFAFFGHYGVQVFIFLSAYGLAKTHWDDSETWASFMWSRIRKLYPMFLLVITLWALLAAACFDPAWVLKDAGPGLLLMLTGISTIVPGLGFPPVGPWWFIPFITQFYAIWPLLRKLTNKFGWQGLVALSLVCYFITNLANPALAHWSINLGATPIGRMGAFCFGIIAARYPIRINAYLAVTALAVLILGNEYRPIAPLASPGSLILFLWIYTRMRSLLRTCNLLDHLGSYSLAIFLVNGIVRIPFIAFTTTPESQLVLGFASAAVTIAISVFFHHLLMLPREVSLSRKLAKVIGGATLEPIQTTTN
jgi:peptidoglycan/LPS O-acetylase OafA/YrhL